MKLRTKIVLLSAFLSQILFAQDNIIWTGAAGDAAFYNEANWKNLATGLPPVSNTINPSVAINANLLIENAALTVGGTSGVNSDILIGTGSLTIRNSSLKMASGVGIDMGVPSNILTIDSAIVYSEFLKNATTKLDGDSKLYLYSADPFDAVSTFNLMSADAWIFAPQLNATTANTTYLSRIKISGNTFVDMTSGRIAQYYNGSAFSGYNSSLTPLRVFEQANLAGGYGDIPVQTIKSGAAIPSSLDNKITSFKLKKGYMATFAVEADGTGISKVYIASESDLIINALPPALTKSISFIRVLPWIWVNKKGTGGNITSPKVSWYYDWGLSNNSFLDREYSTMTWGGTSLDTQTKRNTLISKKKITHVMSFNEPDDCSGQSGQYGLLCVVDTAMKRHKYSMMTGLRIVSPACREHEELVWLKNFNTLAVPAGMRMDVIGIHWYDWGGLNSDSSATSIFNRFKSRVVACYNYYKLPIWVTEFNANPARSRTIQDQFLQLALPWLESTPYIERYAYFQPTGNVANYLDANKNLTSTGLIYQNQVSTPSIPESLVNYYNNNLQSRMNETTGIDDANNIITSIDYEYSSATKSLYVNSMDERTFTLYNLQGVIVQHIMSNTSVSVGDLSRGMYILASAGLLPQKLMLN